MSAWSASQSICWDMILRTKCAKTTYQPIKIHKFRRRRKSGRKVSDAV